MRGVHTPDLPRLGTDDDHALAFPVVLIGIAQGASGDHNAVILDFLFVGQMRVDDSFIYIKWTPADYGEQRVGGERVRCSFIYNNTLRVVFPKTLLLTLSLKRH